MFYRRHPHQVPVPRRTRIIEVVAALVLLVITAAVVWILVCVV